MPTGLPKWDTVWAVPIDYTSVAVSDLLPPGVTVSADGTAFLVDLPQTPVSFTLAELCPACRSLAGQTVPKPPARTSLRFELALPNGVHSVSLAGGELVLETTNRLAFDPIRPSTTARGWWSAALLGDAATPIGADTVDGNQTAMPPGRTRSDRFSLTPAAVTGLTLEYTIDSPVGEAVRIDPSSALAVEVAARDLRATQVTLSFSPKEITTPAVAIDLSDIDPPAIDYIHSVALVLEVQNPFDLQGHFGVIIETADQSFEEALRFEPGASRSRIELTNGEVRAIFGENPPRFRLTAGISTPSGTVAIRPAQVLAFGARLEVVVGPCCSDPEP